MSVTKVENTSILNFVRKELIILFPLTLSLIDLPFFAGSINIILLLFLSLIAFFIFSENILFIWDKNFISLLLYLIFYILFLHLNAFYESVFFYIVLLSVPPSFYILGKYFLIRYRSYKIIYFIVFFLICLFCIGTFISNISDVMENGFMTDRIIKQIGNSKDISATLASARFAVNMSLIAVLFVKTDVRYEKKLQFFGLLLFLIGIFSISNMISRTGLFIAIISILSVFKLMNFKQISNSIFFLSIILIIVFFIAQSMGFFKWFEQSQLYYRLFDEAQKSGKIPRIFRWNAGVMGLFEYPWGGKHTVIEGLYMHNLWLDVGWKVGVIPLFFLLVFTIRYIQTVWRIIKSQFISVFLRSVVLSISIGFLVTFMAEPVMEGLFINFCLFCFFFGIFENIKNINNDKYIIT